MKRFLLGLLLAGLAFPALADLRRETEPNDPASHGATISGPGDVDRYAVRLEVGQTLQAGHADPPAGSSLDRRAHGSRVYRPGDPVLVAQAVRRCLRPLVSSGFSFNHVCRAPGLESPVAIVSEDPAPGATLYFVISGENACGDGSLGVTSTGQEPPNSSPCP